MQLIIKNLTSGQTMTIPVPNMDSHSSCLIATLRVEQDEPDPNQSISAREIYVGTKGGLSIRSV